MDMYSAPSDRDYQQPDPLGRDEEPEVQDSIADLICTCGHGVADHGFRDACHVWPCGCPGFLASDPEPIGWMSDKPAPF